MADILDKQNGNTTQDDEQTALQRMRAALQSEQPPALLGSDGQPIPIPQAVMQILQQTVEHLVRGEYVEVEFFPSEMTLSQAAGILNVSRQFLVKLMNQGDLPVTAVGTRRRVRLHDVLRYKEQRDAKERQGLAELAQLRQEMGAYEDPHQ